MNWKRDIESIAPIAQLALIATGIVFIAFSIAIISSFDPVSSFQGSDGPDEAVGELNGTEMEIQKTPYESAGSGSESPNRTPTNASSTNVPTTNIATTTEASSPTPIDSMNSAIEVDSGTPPPNETTTTNGSASPTPNERPEKPEKPAPKDPDDNTTDDTRTTATPSTETQRPTPDQTTHTTNQTTTDDEGGIIDIPILFTAI